MEFFEEKKLVHILSDCHKSDEIYYLLNAFRLDKKKVHNCNKPGVEGGKNLRYQ